MRGVEHSQMTKNPFPLSRTQFNRRPVNRPIAAHFHSVVLEFACFGEDLGESVCEPVEARAGAAVRERTTEYQHEMLSDEQGVDEAIAT